MTSPGAEAFAVIGRTFAAIALVAGEDRVLIARPR